MKTKLLYVASFLLVFFTSCSLDDTKDELSNDEKELMVQKLFLSFSKSTENSPSFAKLKQTMQSKSSAEWTQEEIKQMEEEFLSKQSTDFLDLYYSVVALNIPNDEMMNILLEYKNILNIDKNSNEDNDDSSNNSDSCSTADSQTSNGSALFLLIIALICS